MNSLEADKRVVRSSLFCMAPQEVVLTTVDRSLVDSPARSNVYRNVRICKYTQQ
jgi:hypothetical protein